MRITAAFSAFFDITVQRYEALSRHCAVPFFNNRSIGVSAETRSQLLIFYQFYHDIRQLFDIAVFIDESVLPVIDQEGSRTDGMACHDRARTVHGLVEHSAPALVKIAGKQKYIGFLHIASHLSCLHGAGHRHAIG